MGAEADMGRVPSKVDDTYSPARPDAKGRAGARQLPQRASASSTAAVKPISEKVSCVCVPRLERAVSTASAPALHRGYPLIDALIVLRRGRPGHLAIG